MALITTKQPPQAAPRSAGAQVVDNQSVQSQFASLTRERDHLRNQCASFEAKTRQQHALIGELQKHQAVLASQLHSAYTNHGIFQKSKALAENEKTRLTNELSKERQELQQAQDKLKSLLETQKQSKLSFLKQMHEWNDELQQILDQTEQQEWSRVISTETIDLIPSHVVDLSSQKALWQEATSKKETAQETQQALMQELESLRAQARKIQVRDCVKLCHWFC